MTEKTVLIAKRNVPVEFAKHGAFSTTVAFGAGTPGIDPLPEPLPAEALSEPIRLIFLCNHPS